MSMWEDEPGNRVERSYRPSPPPKPARRREWEERITGLGCLLFLVWVFVVVFWLSAIFLLWLQERVLQYPIF